MEYDINGFKFITSKKLKTPDSKLGERQELMEEESKIEILFKEKDNNILETEFFDDNIFFNPLTFEVENENKIQNKNFEKVLENKKSEKIAGNKKIYKDYKKSSSAKIKDKRLTRNPKNFHEYAETENMGEIEKIKYLIAHSEKYFSERECSQEIKTVTERILDDLDLVLSDKEQINQLETEMEKINEDIKIWKEIKNEIYENYLMNFSSLNLSQFLAENPKNSEKIKIENLEIFDGKKTQILKMTESLNKCLEIYRGDLDDIFQKIFSVDGKRIKLDPYAIIRSMIGIS